METLSKAANAALAKSSSAGRNVLSSVSNAIVGKDAVIMRVFLAILARGHVLIEDIPGVGKTTLAIAFSSAYAPSQSVPVPGTF